MKTTRNLTLEEREYIEKRLKEGIAQYSIAKELDRSGSTICYELKRCEKGNYNAVKAHEISRTMDKDQRKRTNIGGDHYTKMKNRITTLEMQMEIVMDLLAGKD